MFLKEKEYFLEKLRKGELKKIQMDGCALLIPPSFIEVDIGIAPTECKYAGVVTNQRPLKYPDAPMFYFFYKRKEDIWPNSFADIVWQKCREKSEIFAKLKAQESTFDVATAPPDITTEDLKTELDNYFESPAFDIYPVYDFDHYISQLKHDPNYQMPYDTVIMRD